MDANTEAIVRLCFARQLGLADDALEGEGRVAVVRDDLLMTLRLWRTVVVVAPADLQRGLAELDDRAVTDPSALLARSGGGRLLGEAQLSVAVDFDSHPELRRLEIEPDPGAAVALERRCPPDDVTEVGLSEMEQVFVHAAPDGTPLAGSGHSAWAGLVADIGVLTAPDARRGGLGRLLAGIAVNDALDSGLVPVWRARRGSAVSERLAQRLGFVPFGAQTTVAVPGR